MRGDYLKANKAREISTKISNVKSNEWWDKNKSYIFDFIDRRVNEGEFSLTLYIYNFYINVKDLNNKQIRNKVSKELKKLGYRTSFYTDDKDYAEFTITWR